MIPLKDQTFFPSLSYHHHHLFSSLSLSFSLTISSLSLIRRFPFRALSKTPLCAHTHTSLSLYNSPPKRKKGGGKKGGRKEQIFRSLSTAWISSHAGSYGAHGVVAFLHVWCFFSSSSSSSSPHLFPWCHSAKNFILGGIFIIF